MERGGAAATASAAGAKVFGGSRLKTDPLWNFNRGGGCAPCAPPPLNPLVVTWNPLQIRTNLLLMMDSKSYGLSFGGICFDLE